METAKDWLAKWDSKEPVWSIEMGGIGPGYEQAIQVTTAEIIRFLVTDEIRLPDPHDGEAKASEWEALDSLISKSVLPRIEGGLSGAQWGAAMNLAIILYRRGTAALDDDEVKDRRILVSNSFPHVAAQPVSP